MKNVLRWLALVFVFSGVMEYQLFGMSPRSEIIVSRFQISNNFLVTIQADNSMKFYKNWGLDDSQNERWFLLCEFGGHQSKVVSVDLDCDERLLASASEDGEIRIWNVLSGEYLYSLNNDNECPRDVRFGLRDDDEGDILKVCYQYKEDVNIFAWRLNNQNGELIFVEAVI